VIADHAGDPGRPLRAVAPSPQTADTGGMHRHKEQLDRLLRGPAGGMFACLLLAATLGGVAAAGPGGAMFEPGGGAGTGPGAAAAAAAEHGNGNGNGSEGGGPAHIEVAAYDVQDCRRSARSLDDTLAPGQPRGLAHAIGVVLVRCERHAEAPGLLRALERLVANYERQLARDEAKAAGEPGASGTAPGHTGTPPGHEGREPGGAGSPLGPPSGPSVPATGQGGGSQGGGSQGS